MLLGEAYQQAGDTPRALELWGEALRHRPEDSRLRERLERAARAARVEERYEARESHHFRLRAEGAIPRGIQEEALALLEQAGVHEVGRLLRRLGEGVSWEWALEGAARMDVVTFEREWQEHLRR